MDYSDIINLPHHVSKKHKPMSALNRAAQFAPFSALTGYDDAIVETARTTDNSIEISDDRAVLLDRSLSELSHALVASTSSPVEVTITLFVHDIRKEGGHYDTFTAAVKSIDENARRIVLSDGRMLNINDIVSLSMI